MVEKNFVYVREIVCILRVSLVYCREISRKWLINLTSVLIDFVIIIELTPAILMIRLSNFLRN